ncbi:MAG TPA: aldose 1-epimerase, partial [Cytophagaceae bacterium]|nr:aldose 1-epimerase [Cytophagaceae bacterium]
IDKGEYTFLENNYRLEKNHVAEGHAIHGLVYRSKFVIDPSSDINNGILTLKYNSSGRENGYPFLYELELQFSLSDNGFKCITIVENKDNKIIPIGDGWHPYFSTGTIINDLLIKIPSAEYIEVDKNKIPTGKININNEYLNLKLLGKTVFDTCFKLPGVEGTQSIELFDPKKDIRINIWQETGENKYNYVQVYTHPSRKSIAIEPMSCIPDSFNNKSGLIMLLPGEKRKFTYGVQLGENLKYISSV